MAFSSVSATEVEKKSTTDHPDWLELPRDVIANILKRLHTIEIVTNACQVCPLWWNIRKDSQLWCTIHMTKLRYSSFNNGDNLVKICRYAIERSYGQLEGIHIEFFATDDLLAYISDCASHLSCMWLIDCRGVSDKGFNEAVKKFPQLQELDISFNNNLSKDSLEVVGRRCPLLKSLIYSGVVADSNGNDVSFSIAETMSGLHHLKIYGDMPTDDGVRAILDGCPLLESFDVKGCCSVYFSESLVKRCRKQVKDFGRPLPLCPTYNWDLQGENSNISSYLECYFDMQ